MRFKVACILGALLMFMSDAVFAAPTLVGSKTDASGIDGVVVDGVTYNVVFSRTSFGSTFTSYSSGEAAGRALTNALDALGVTGLSYGGTSGYSCDSKAGTDLCVIFSGSNDGLGGASILEPRSWTNFWSAGFNLGCTGSAEAQCVEAAHWTRTST